MLTPPSSSGANAARTARTARTISLPLAKTSHSLVKSCLFLACAAALLSSSAARAQAVLAAPRIVQAIDETNLVTLKGNTHPAANARNDRGQVSSDLPMTDLILVLSRSPEQQAAFTKFVASQYDAESPNFHHWLKPAEVGADFGPSQTDVAVISQWLTGHGFSVTQVSNDRMSIRFNGTAAQVESAFHTEIHNLEVNGVRHIGNMSDPAIPAALAPAVVGIKSLHNFFPRPLHRLGQIVSKDPSTGKWKRAAKISEATTTGSAPRTGIRPQFSIDDTTDGYEEEDETPYDFATIYNVLPLWNASTPIDGTGQTIAIAGTSAIVESDIDTFRSSFGLPAYTSANRPTVISGNSSPLTVCPDSAGLCTMDDLIENSLDVEWSGAVAKGANIVLVASYPTSATDDNLYDSESYVVNHQTASILSSSYGVCELGNGTAGNVEYYNLWQSAASEGIAVFVAAGDGGASECDDGGDSVGNPYSAQFGLAVNGLASTPYNTAVGGTDFNWCSPASTTACSPTPYWNATNNATTGASAIGYVPEVPWNDTCSDALAVPLFQAVAGSTTTVTDPESACNYLYNNWQTLQNTYSYIADYVDTVGGGGGASNCVVSDSNSTCTSGATSTGATTNPDTGAAQTSVTLVNNGWPKPSWQAGVSGIPSDGVRDIPDVSFFASDGFISYSAYLICVSEAGSACTYTDSADPADQEVGGTSVSSPAMAGVMALINQKAGESQGNPNSELYTLASKQTYANCSAESVKTTASCYFNDIDTQTNAMPCDYGAEEGDPASAGIKSPNCTVAVSTDTIGILSGNSATPAYDLATGLGSLNVANVVNAWPVSTATSKATVTVTPASTTVSAGSALTVAVTVAASTGSGTPTGKVTILGGQYTSGAQALSSGKYSFSIPANSLTAGSDVFTVSYTGDTTFGAATGTATVTVTAVAGTSVATVTVTPAATSLTTSTALSVPVTVAGPSGSATPTGTVTLSGGGYTSTAETLSTGAYTFAIPANSLTAGSDTLTVTYSGDTNYASATGTATVTVTAGTSTGTFTLSAAAPAAVAPGTNATTTVTVTSTGGYAGTASLTSCALTSSPSGAVDVPACTLSPATVTLSSSSPSGTVTATITTTAPTATTSQLISPRRPARRAPSGAWTGGGAVLTLLVFFGIPARRRAWRAMLGALLLIAALGGLSACGDFWQAPGGDTADGTTTGNYVFTVTGSGSPAVSSAVTTTFTVTVN